MKCPHCGEDLGINDICIKPTCTNFGSKPATNHPDDNTSNKNNNANNNFITIDDDVNNTPNVLTIKENRNNTNSTSDNRTYTENSKRESDNNLNRNFGQYNSSSYNNSGNVKNPIFNRTTSSDENSNAGGFKTAFYAKDISDEEFLAFFKKDSSDYYFRRVNQYRYNNHFSSWNWPAFFLSVYWLFYRKLYGYAFAFLGLKLLGLFIGPISLLLHILLGIFANSLYINAAEKRIRAEKTFNNGLNNDEYLMRLTVKGGTNIAAPLIFLGLIIVIIIIIVAFFAIAAFLNDSPTHFSGYRSF